MPDDFDAQFDELGTRLRATAPHGIDAETALHTLRPALQRARRRRQATTSVLSGLGIAAAIAIGTIAIGTGGGPDVQVPPAGRDRTPVVSNPDGTPTSTTSTTNATSTTSTTIDDHGGSSGKGRSGDDSSGSSGSGSSGSGSSGDS